jgi:cytochrome b561
MTDIASSISSKPSPSRYHPALVVLHWLIAFLIFGTAFLVLGVGGEGRRELGFSIAGVPILGIHMILGLVVLVLLITRLVIRLRTAHPSWAGTGSALLDKVGVFTHWALYFFTFAITITGLILALQTNRLARVFNPGAAQPGFAFSRPAEGQLPPPGQFQPGQFPPGGQFRPGGFEGRFPREGGFFLGAFHGLSWTLLLLLVVLHAGAALYHQFLRRDGLLGRMWFGKRYA